MVTDFRWDSPGRGDARAIEAYAALDANATRALVGDAQPFGDDPNDAGPAPTPYPYARIMDLLRRMDASPDAKRERSLWRPILRVALGDDSGDGAALVKLVTRGRNKGAAYVTSDRDEYHGRIESYGAWAPVGGRASDARLLAALDALDADPDAALVAYGRVFGSCGICGRRLMNRESIERGIGPICAGRLGL